MAFNQTLNRSWYCLTPCGGTSADVLHSLPDFPLKVKPQSLSVLNALTDNAPFNNHFLPFLVSLPHFSTSVSSTLNYLHLNHSLSLGSPNMIFSQTCEMGKGRHHDFAVSKLSCGSCDFLMEEPSLECKFLATCIPFLLPEYNHNLF